MSTYHLSAEAKRDLESIHDYIAEDNPAAALRVVVRIKETCELLAQFPLIGRIRPELGKSIRSFPVKSHLLLYRLGKGEIEIARVYHMKRDLRKLEGTFDVEP